MNLDEYLGPSHSFILQRLAKLQDITVNEALQRALVTEDYMLEQRNNGARVLIQRADKEIREVKFKE